MPQNRISYSDILIDFIQPLITGEEDENEFFDKAKLGQIAWNFSISDLNELPFDGVHKQIFLTLTASNPEMKAKLNRLVLRKATKFSEYNQFIYNVEIREKRPGEKILYVESIPADKISEL